MSITESCPTDSEVKQLFLGQVPEDRLRALTSHLEECPACQTRILELSPEQTRITRVLGQLSDGGKAPAGIEETERTPGDDLLERLELLGTQGSSIFGGPVDGEPKEENFPFLAPAEEPDELGRIAHYRVLKLLGRGGIGMVFLAEDTKLSRQVAIKVLRTKYARRPEAKERLLREARSLAGVKHDNIAVLHEVGEVQVSGDRSQESGDRYVDLTPDSCLPTTVTYLSLDLLEGQSLAEWMRENRKPDVRFIIQVARQVASGLAAAHARGLVHRDIKPSNLWLEVAGTLRVPSASSKRHAERAYYRIKILDFGLSSAIDEAATEIVGTPAYMAPEQIRGEPLDARCDLFGLGCVLYELCTGELPFRRDVKAIRDRRSDDPPPTPIHKLNPTIPVPLQNLIHRLLAKAPMERPRTAPEVDQRLAKIERRLWLLRQPWWIKWGAAAALLAFFGGIAWGISPLFWALTGMGEYRPKPVVYVSVAPEADPEVPDGSSDDKWRRIVSQLPGKRQAAAVGRRLKELNPEFTGHLQGVQILEGRVIEVRLQPFDVSNIQPLAALTSLRVLRCDATQNVPGRLTDLSPIEQLPLETLIVSNNPGLVDFSALRNMKLVQLDASATGLADLNDIDRTNLQTLTISNTQVRDLSPIKDMPNLTSLTCFHCPLGSLEPLVDTGIRSLQITYQPERDMPILRRMKQLQSLNSGPMLRLGP